MKKVLKTISFGLSTDSIDLALREIADFQKQLEECMMELIKYLVAYGQEVAKMNVYQMDAVFTGELADNGISGFYDTEKRCGVVYTDKPYAIFVEYGTGIVGAEGPKYPGKKADGYEYDYHDHGHSGWWYPAEWGWWIPKEGKHAGELMAWTKGMPSRPFMYNTFRELERIAKEKGIDFFTIY